SDQERRDGRRANEWNAYDSNEWNVWSLPPAAYPDDGEAAEEPLGISGSNGAGQDDGAAARARDPGFARFHEGLADVGSTSDEERQHAMTPDREVPGMSRTEAGEFPDVPDADAIAADSPVDPASPPDQFHGTDLLNGVGLHPEEETDDSLI